MLNQEELKLFLDEIEKAKKTPIGRLDLERLVRKYGVSLSFNSIKEEENVIIKSQDYSEKFTFTRRNDGLYYFDYD